MAKKYGKSVKTYGLLESAKKALFENNAPIKKTTAKKSDSSWSKESTKKSDSPQKQKFAQFQKKSYLQHKFGRALFRRSEQEREEDAERKASEPKQVKRINVAGGYYQAVAGQFGKAVTGTLAKNTTDLAMNATQGFIQSGQEGYVGAQKLVTGNKDKYDIEREERIKKWEVDWYRKDKEGNLIYPEDKPIVLPTDSVKRYYEQAYKDATDTLDRLNAGTDAARKMDIYEGDYEGADTIEALTAANKGIEKAQTKVDKVFTEFADLESQPYFTRFVANAVGSVPTSLVSLLPFGTGFSINYMAQKQAAIDEKYAQLTANGHVLTSQEKADIFTYAENSALIEAASEQIWSFGGTNVAKDLAKQMLKAPTKSVLKQLVKEAVKSGAQEGFEEIVSGLGQGFLAKLTTDKDATLFSVADETSLIYLFGEGSLAEQAASGFVMGSAMNVATSYKNKDAFKKTNEFYESTITIDGKQTKVKDVPLEKLTVEIQEKGIEALLKDLENPSNVALVKKEAAVSAEQIEMEQPIDKQIQKKREILTNAYKSVAENKTPQQQEQYEKLTKGLKTEIAQDEEYKKSLAKVKSKYTASQLTTKIDRKDAEIAELETELVDASPEDRASIQEEITLQKSLRENYRATLERVAAITPDMSPHSVELVSSKPVDAVVEETNNVAMQEDSGVKTATGGVTESAAIKNAPSGNVIESIKSPNKHVFSTAKAVQIGDIIASTDAYGNVNPKFPKERQPRFVERKSSTEQIADIAYKTDFMMYAGVERVQDGVPMVSADGVGIIGNHRLAALLLMFKENIAKFRQYQAYMIKNASKFGLNPAEMTGDFIVVRALSADEDLDSLVNEGNISGTAAMSASEIAVVDSKKLTDSVMAWFVTDENGEMTGAANKTFNNRFINEVVPESERASMRDGNGEISMNGLRRIQNAMFYKAYGNIDLLTRVSESTDNNVKKLTNTLINVSPRIVTLKEGIAAGKYYDVATAQLITDVATKWVTMKQSKEGKNILAYLKGDTKQRQADMFNEKENPLEMSMILAFEVNRGSGKNLTSLINRIIDLHMAEGTPENGFFGLDQKTVNLETIINTALEGKEYGTIQDLESLYAESGDGTEGAVTAVGSVERGQKESEPVKVAAQEVQGEATPTIKPEQTLDEEIKADVEKAETRTQSAIEAIAEANKSDDTEGEHLRFAKGNFRFDEEKKEINTYGMSEETISEMKRTESFDSVKATLTNAINKTREFLGGFNLGSVAVSNDKGDVKRAIRKYRTAQANAATLAVESIKASYGKLNRYQLNLMKKAVTLFDIRENIEKGLYANKPLPYKFKTIDEALTVIQKIDDDYNAKENELVRKAYDTRKKIFDALREEVISAGKAVGLDYSFIKSRDYYSYNAVYEVYNALGKRQLRGKGVKFHKREGSAKAYISDPIKCDYIVMTKLKQTAYKLEVLKEVVLLDISDKIEFNKETGERIIPDGYVETNKNAIIGNVQITDAVETQAYEIAIKKIKEEGIDLESELGQKLTKGARFLSRKSTIVIPLDVFKAVTDEYAQKQTKGFAKVYGKVYQAWKFIKTRMPFAVFKYNFRNAMGDLEMVFAGLPTAIFKAPKATWDLFKYFYLRNRKDVTLMNWMEQTGGITGMTVQEFAATEKIPELDFLYRTASPKAWGKKAIKSVWHVLTMDTFTPFREQILRYSAYLRIKEIIIKKDGKITNYIASSRAEIDSIKNIDDKAIKMANDLLGAYDDVSPMGQWIANNAIPFFRFKEISIKRYIRLAQNAFYSDGEMINKQGQTFAKKFGISSRIGLVGTMKLGWTCTKVQLFYAAVNALSALFGGEDDDALPEDVKNQPHITFPAGLFGDDGRVFYLSNLGIFSELLGTAGIDYGEGRLIADLFTGRRTWDEFVEELSVGITPAKLIFSINPILLESWELATGKKGYYFDPENPTEIRNRWDYFFTEAGFGQFYRKLAGMPENFDTTVMSAFANNISTGDSAMWSVYDMMDDYYDEKGIDKYNPGGYDRGSVKWKKANAAYYYKLAIKLNDKVAIENYLAQYVALGGTLKTINQSVATLEPLRFMDEDLRDDFIDQLTDEEKDTLKRAQKYYKEILKYHNEITEDNEELFD